MLPPRHDERERVRKPADELAAMRNQVLLWVLGEVDVINFSLKPIQTLAYTQCAVRSKRGR